MSLTCIPEQITVPLEGRNRVRQGSSFLLSVVIHLLLLIIFTWAIRNPPARPHPPSDTAVEISLISLPEPLEQEKAPSNEQEPEADLEPRQPLAGQSIKDNKADSSENVAVLSVSPLAPELKRVRQIYANRILASDDGRAAKEGLLTAHGEERWIQLCNLEALEQLANGDPLMSPQQIIAHTRAPIEVKPNHISAFGAAVYSNDSWFDLQFECWFQDGALELSDFAFRLGGRIPRGHWESLWLPEPHNTNPKK